MLKISFVSVPESNSKPRDLAIPICGTVVPEFDLSVPLTLVAVSYKLIFLKGSTIPETNPISGEPKTFDTLTKFLTL